MKKKRFRQTKRDTKMMTFIWKHKVVPTCLLHSNFYFNSSHHLSYKRLLKLREAKLIDGITVKTSLGDCWVWKLTKKGFDLVRDSNPDIEKQFFKSECPLHDLYVLSALYGPWIREIPSNVSVTTEQELDCYSSKFSSQILGDDFERRPDGVWSITIDSQRWNYALELEYSPTKSTELYEGIALDYDSMTSISRVFWLVNGAGPMKKIYKSLQSALNESQVKHNFVLLGEFEEKSWGASVEMGPEQGLQMSSILMQTSGSSLDTRPTQEILKGQKRSVSSAFYADSENSGISI